MSDAPVAAPGGAAPAAAPAQAPATTAPPKPKAPGAPSWGEKDDAELIERIKRSPYGKLKADGKEEHIDSPDALKRLLLDAQRGKGANRLVEQTKREKAEAEKMAAEAKQERALLERARRGDKAAARELGLIPDDERQREQQEWESLPPEVKALVQQNQELANRLKEREEAERKTLAEREEAKKRETRESTLKRAKEMATEVLKDVREEFHDVELPDVIMAMEALRESGLKMGVDYNAEQLRAYVEQQREESVWGRVSRTKPDVALKRVAPLLKSLKADQLEGLLGEDFVPIAKLISAAWLGHHKRKSAPKPQGAAAASAAEPQRKPPEPLSRFRFGGR